MLNVLFLENRNLFLFQINLGMKLFFALLSLLAFNYTPEPHNESPVEEVIVWGQTGHRVIGLIAEDHLTRKARRKLKNF